MGRSGVITSAVMSSAGMINAAGWWQDVNNSRLWQDRIFHVLSALYGIVAFIALVQLIRIQLRVPEYGWTTQKVFHFLNFIVNGVRSLVFVFRRSVQRLHPEIVQHILLDMPSLAFFTTYALLVLFWAEIYYQARAASTDGLRPSFFTINAVVYVVQVYCKGKFLTSFLKLFLDCYVVGLMVEAYPTRNDPIKDVLCRCIFVCSTWISTLRRKVVLNAAAVPCFLIRCVMMCFNAFDKAADLDVLDHPILNLIYYVAVEILPSSLVLFILRKLPPKRGITPYHLIR